MQPWSLMVVACGLGAFAGIVWFHAVASPDGKLHVHFLDVGQGDSVLIETPGGRQVLIDGGPTPLGAARPLGDVLPFWDRRLDMVVLTHPDEDHFRGLVEVLHRYDVDVVLDSGLTSENPMFQAWQDALEREVPRTVRAYQGQTVVLDRDTWIEVLGPPDPMLRTSADRNNNGVVLRLVHGQVSFLLTADIEKEAEAWLTRSTHNLASTVLKAPHHGSRTSTSPIFLSAVRPAAAVISVGASNRYGHPHPEVKARLEATVGPDRLYTTAERGNIEFTTDGRRLWVKSQR